MAQHTVRKETAGSIFYRITGLLRSGQLQWKNRPLWYDVYVAYPPKYEPTAVAPFSGQKEPIRALYYKEDFLRAQFYKQFPSVGAISISNEESQSLCQLFIDLYAIAKKKWPDLSKEMLHQKALVMLSEKLRVQKQVNESKLPT